MEYRKLTAAEIAELQKNGCRAEDWDNVQVSWEEGQSFTQHIINASFSGEIRLGAFNGEFLLQGGIPVHCGISNAALHNVTMGNNCILRNVHDYIANYTIGDCCLIDDVDLIYTDGESTFGNGTEASVLNEAGGREVVITDILTSQTAYLMAMNGPVSETIREISRAYAATTASSVGVIGNMVTVRGAGTMVNVCLGDSASVIGAARLVNGTVNSSENAPSKVGQGVMAEDFVFSSGSTVENGAALTKCFVGQASHIGRYFSAVDSLFFSNCHFENGEACALFAGPFTVSHHKATLMIAGLFSFSNAGSASNQSNHMYKTGPVHFGMLGRGSNLASGSHILWPLQTAPFTMVMGKHISHADTTAMPFSYLIERGGVSRLSPAVNLYKAGTARDFGKWPKRDGRKGEDLLDVINFNQISPYTAGLMLKGLEDLRTMAKSPAESYFYNGAVISASALEKGIDGYTAGLTRYLGGLLVNNRERLTSGMGNGPWSDICGLLAPSSEIEAVLQAIQDGAISDLDSVNAAFADLHSRYEEMEMEWAADAIESFFGISLEDLSEDKFNEINAAYGKASDEIRLAIIRDAEKDVLMAGGDPDANSFITSLKNQNK